MAFTYFFRDQHTLEHVVEQVTHAFSGSSRIRVWDAGCAMGPEPYSLAMLFAERMGQFAFRNLHFDATDVDGSQLFGEIIARGVYDDDVIGRIPQPIRDKYFRKADAPGKWEIHERLRARVRFHRHDLLSLAPVGDEYALVVCKNVLLHFQPAERVDVLRMYHRVLLPGGFLAMEQTQKLPEELTPLFEHVVGDAQLYRKRARPDTPS